MKGAPNLSRKATLQSEHNTRAPLAAEQVVETICLSGSHILSSSRCWPREGQAHVAMTRAGKLAHAVLCGSRFTFCGREAARILSADYARSQASLILSGARCEACSDSWWARRVA